MSMAENMGRIKCTCCLRWTKNNNQKQTQTRNNITWGEHGNNYINISKEQLRAARYLHRLDCPTSWIASNHKHTILDN